MDFVLAQPRSGRECRNKSQVVWPGQQSTHQLLTSFPFLLAQLLVLLAHICLGRQTSGSQTSGSQTGVWSRIDTRDVTLARLQMTRESASDTVSAGMESTSLVNMVSQGYCATYQTDSWVYNIKTVALPCHSLIESSSKYVGHNNQISISTSDNGEISPQEPYIVLHDKIPKETAAEMVLKPSNLASLILDHCWQKPYWLMMWLLIINWSSLVYVAKT